MRIERRKDNYPLRATSNQFQGRAYERFSGSSITLARLQLKGEFLDIEELDFEQER